LVRLNEDITGLKLVNPAMNAQFTAPLLRRKGVFQDSRVGPGDEEGWKESFPIFYLGRFCQKFNDLEVVLNLFDTVLQS